MQADYHMHTHNSGDSTAPMDAMIESAISLGLDEICFTEHMDMDFPISEEVPKDTFLLDTKSYYEEVMKYKDLYSDRITIKFGVELGLQPHLAERIREYVSSFPFDFIIGSIHLLDGMDPYYPAFWNNKKEEDVIRRYFEYTLENIESIKDFDVLGHLDYITRYAPGSPFRYDYELFKDIIDEILKKLIAKGKGLDFNTSSMFKGAENPNPSPVILKRYKELGGSIITFGSDAHTPKAVAGCFDKAREIAASCGFSKYCTYEKRVLTSNSL